MNPLSLSKEKTIAIITNAIAWEMIPHEKNDDGEITLSKDEVALCKRAAERVYRQAIEGRD